MIPPGPNPHAPRRCLPGRAYSTCALALSGTAVLPIATPDNLSESRFSLPPTELPLPTLPLGGIDHLTFVFPPPQTTTLATEQYPLKIDLRAKV